MMMVVVVYNIVVMIYNCSDDCCNSDDLDNDDGNIYMFDTLVVMMITTGEYDDCDEVMLMRLRTDGYDG